ncbi:MAG: AraC family transcriptional regulator [Bacillota bacterium]
MAKFQNTHLAVSSYFSIKVDKSSFNIIDDNFIAVILIESGNGTLFGKASGNSERVRNVAKIKKGDIIITNNLYGRIDFEDSGKLTAICFNTVLNSDKIVKTSDYALGAGDILEIKPQLEHIDFSTYSENISELTKILEREKFLQFSTTSYLSFSIHRLVDHLNLNRLSNFDSLYSQLMIMTILEDIKDKLSHLDEGNNYINEIVKFIDLNHSEDISLDDIAKGVGLNKSYMQKIFSSKMGNTIHDYLTQYRVNKAIEIMRSTSLPLVDIGIEVGFQNRQTFTSTFKKFTGYSPSVFRKFLTTSMAKA